MDQQVLIDCAVELNLVPGDYFALWDDLAAWQAQTLRAAGLLPRHCLLDIGCGAMRLGLSIVEYLDDGNYVGYDAFEPYIALGHRLAERAGLRKRYTLVQSERFDFERAGMRFDFANAQSVFTHLSETQSAECMSALAKCMTLGGRFLFTYLIGAVKTQGFLYAGQQPMRRPAVTDPDYYRKLGERHGCRFEKLDVAHPTGQQVGLYHFPS
jgi:SAM-dependent methyltransferase